MFTHQKMCKKKNCMKVKINKAVVKQSHLHDSSEHLDIKLSLKFEKVMIFKLQLFKKSNGNKLIW